MRPKTSDPTGPEKPKVAVGDHHLDDPEYRPRVPQEVVLHRHVLRPDLSPLGESFDVLIPPWLGMGVGE